HREDCYGCACATLDSRAARARGIPLPRGEQVRLHPAVERALRDYECGHPAQTRSTTTALQTARRPWDDEPGAAVVRQPAPGRRNRLRRAVRPRAVPERPA